MTPMMRSTSRVYGWPRYFIAIWSTLADDASVNGEDPVGEREDFVDVARVDHYRGSRLRCRAQRSVHCFGGPDVQAARGILHHQQRWIGSQFAAQDHLLLIPAREGSHWCWRISPPHIVEMK